MQGTGHQVITDQDQDKRNLQKLQRLKQHKLSINLSLNKVKVDIFLFKVLNKELQHQYVPQLTLAIFQIGDLEQITNYLCD